MESLWPEQIDEWKVKPPVAILRQQAALLGPMTQGIVEARVTRLGTKEPNEFAYRFELVAPGLGRYTYSLFVISHEVELYPVQFVLDLSLSEDLRHEEGFSRMIEVDNEAEFVGVLREILRAEKTKRIIGSLLAQAEYEEPSDEDEIPF
jgi:hypothetical protein